jgi:hypothetical protein
MVTGSGVDGNVRLVAVIIIPNLLALDLVLYSAWSSVAISGAEHVLGFLELVQTYHMGHCGKTTRQRSMHRY